MSGIAGFINGVFAGMDWREGREDRQRVRKMQDEKFGWDREDQAWQREERDYTRSERARTAKETEEQKALRRRFGDAYADELFGTSSMGVTDAVSPAADTAPAATTGPSPADYPIGTPAPASAPAPTVPTAVTASTKTPEAPTTRPKRRPELSLGVVGAGATPPSVMSDAPVLAQPAPVQTPTYRNTDGTPYNIGMSLNEALAELGPDAVGYRQGQIDPRLARAVAPQSAPVAPPTAPVARPAPRGAVVEGGAIAAYPNYSAAGGASAPGVGNAARPGDYQAQATARTLAEVEAPRAADPTVAMGDEALYANAARAMVQSAEQNLVLAQQALAESPSAATQARASQAAQALKAARDEAATLAQAPVPQARPTYSVRSLLAAEGPEATGRAAPMPVSGAGQTVLTPSATAAPAAPAPAAPVTQAVAPPASAPVSARPTGAEQRFAPNGPPRPVAPRPELSFGAQAAPLSMGVAGTNGAAPPTKKQQARAVTAAVDKYNEDSKALMSDLIAAGLNDEAKMFGDWMKEKGTQRGLESAMKLGMALTVGDTKAVETALVETYNNDQYFDDGYTIVPGTVKTTLGTDGRTIVGASYTLRSDATGEEFVQEAEGEDLGRLAFERADPYTVFKEGMAARQSAESDMYKLAYTEAEEAARARGKASGEGAPTIDPSKAVETIEGAAMTTQMTPEQKAEQFDALTGGKYPGANPYRAGASASGVGSSVPVVRRPTE